MSEREEHLMPWEEKLIEPFVDRDGLGDPMKPLNVDGDGMVRPNPRFAERQAAYQPENFGTSFFINFHPKFQFHKLPGTLGDHYREQITHRYRDICLGCLMEVIGMNEWTCEVMMNPEPHPWMHNGEMYGWLWGCNLEMDDAFRVLGEIIQELRDRPIIITVDGQIVEVPFYGYGVRTFNF